MVCLAQARFAFYIRQVIFVDNRNSSDPYINLAIEDFLVRIADCRHHDYLLLYINRPCIVVGKNQSIYKEINFEYLRNNKLQLCRRISGGGTVYQDEGNLSFSIITRFEEHKINNYQWFNTPVINLLGKMGVVAETDNRNNIICRGKKISGSAQFTNRKNMISHGTLLVNANLAELRKCLSGNDFEVNSKAVGSVRSPVMNIAEVSPAVQDAETLRTALKNELTSSEALTLSNTDWQTISSSACEKFASFEWIYGRSPLTKIIKPKAEIEIENGIITSIKSKLPAADGLKGVPYQHSELKKALNNRGINEELIFDLF